MFRERRAKNSVPAKAGDEGAIAAGSGVGEPWFEPHSSEPRALVLALARALHQSGIPAHRLEELLQRLAERLALTGRFYCTPTAIFASFETAERPMEPHTHLMRLEPADIDLGRQRRIDRLIGEVLSGELDPHGALAQITELQQAAPLHGPLLTVLSFGAISAGVAVVLAGGLADLSLSLLAGLLVGLLGLFAGHSQQFSRVFEAVAALITTLSAQLAGLLWPGVAPMVVLVAGLIVLLPGLTLTVALTELATNNLVAGTARLLGAAIVFIKLGFGVALGVGVIGSLGYGVDFGAPPAQPLPLWAQPAALALVGSAATVLFRARWADLPWVMLGCAVATVGAKAGGALMGPQLGAFFGALAIGVTSNGLARWRQQPTTLTLIPGVLLLVPGSLGFRSVTALLQQDVSSGIGGAFSMFMVAISLVAGLLMANLLVHPRRAL